MRHLFQIVGVDIYISQGSVAMHLRYGGFLTLLLWRACSVAVYKNRLLGVWCGNQCSASTFVNLTLTAVSIDFCTKYSALGTK